MLAERFNGAGPQSLRFVGAAVAAGLGLAAIGVLAPAEAADGVTDLAVAVPLVAPAGQTGMLDADALTQYTREGGLLDRQLDAVVGREVTIGVDPMILVSIRLLGSAAPESALAWLDRLEAAPNDTFPLAYADTDLTLATQAAPDAVPEPESFQFAVDPQLFAPADQTTPTPAPTATPDPDAAPELPPLPSDEDLLAWPYSLSGIAWPRENTVVGADLGLLAASGYETAIVSSGNVSREGRGTAATTDPLTLAVSDDVVSRELRDAVSAGTVDIAPLIAAVAAAGGDGTVLATMDRGIPPSSDRLAEVLDALAADPAISLVPLSDALGEAPDEARISDQPQPADRLTRAAALIESDAATRTFARIAEDPAAITSAQRLELLALLANAWSLNTEGWNTVTEEALAAGAELRASVQVVEASSLLLVADNNQFLPVTVSNALDQPVTVQVTLRPTTALLVVLQERVELVVPPQSQSRVDIPVQSIANGEVEYVITLTDGVGSPVGDQAFGEVNVQAGWETPIVVVLAVIVVLVFAVGIVRTILRRRKARTEDAAG